MKKINWQLLWKIIIIIIIIIIITIVVITDSECKIENNNCLTFLDSDNPIPCKLSNFFVRLFSFRIQKTSSVS